MIPNSASISINETVTPTLSFQPSDATKTVTWSSSDSSIASVSTTGTITGKNGGSATIYAKSTLNQNIYATVSITVKAAKQCVGISYTGTPEKLDYFEGESFDPTGITVTARYNDDSTSDVTSQVVWSPSKLTLETSEVTGTFNGFNVYFKPLK